MLSSALAARRAAASVLALARRSAKTCGLVPSSSSCSPATPSSSRLLHASSRLTGDAAGSEAKPRTAEEQTEWVRKDLGDEWQGFGIHPHDKEHDAEEANIAFFAVACMAIMPFFLWYYSQDSK